MADLIFYQRRQTEQPKQEIQVENRFSHYFVNMVDHSRVSKSRLKEKQQDFDDSYLKGIGENHKFNQPAPRS